jgi:hypothetical protein
MSLEADQGRAAAFFWHKSQDSRHAPLDTFGKSFCAHIFIVSMIVRST